MVGRMDEARLPTMAQDSSAITRFSSRDPLASKKQTPIYLKDCQKMLTRPEIGVMQL